MSKEEKKKEALLREVDDIITQLEKYGYVKYCRPSDEEKKALEELLRSLGIPSSMLRETLRH